MNQQSQEVYKIILVGDQGVGKSSILLRYTQNIFNREYNVTIGLEFASKKVSINESFLTLQIWDTAGQEAFRSIVRSFYRNSAAIIIVYKVTSRDSFNSIMNWAREITENSDPGAVIALVGNMTDLQDDRVVTTEEGQEKAREINALFYETSAANGSHIDDIFIKTLEKISQTSQIRSDSQQNVRDSITLTQKTQQQQIPDLIQLQQEKKKDKGCC